VLPTKPRTPRHKGKVERGVDYVQENALKGRTFKSLQEQNDHLLCWETTIADTRIHGTTRKQVSKLFEVERESLGKLPLDYFPCFQEAQRKVSRDGHVSVDKAYYSLPPEFVGHTLWVGHRRGSVGRGFANRSCLQRQHETDLHARNADAGKVQYTRRTLGLGEDSSDRARR
ncbi:hypothetical protein ACFL2H_11785, partial [Planctomycetota bacterium]